MTPFDFCTTPRLVCAPGASAALGAHGAALGISRALLVSDRGVLGAGLSGEAEASLSAAGIGFERFDAVVADPPEAVVEAAVAQARAQGVDGVIGLGGGSSLDVAKLTALIARSGEPLADLYGVDRARGARLPLVLVPTTAGTGSEVTPVAIITTGAHTKAGVVARQLLPDIAVLDAALTTGLPAATTAATGVDAMVHAIEAFTSAHKKNPYSDLLARRALQLLAANVHRAVNRGDDLAARAAMLFGACLAGQAFANAPVAAVHALAYPIGGHYGVAHGLSNALVLSEVLRFNAPAAQPLYAELAGDLLGPLGGTEAARCTALIDYLERLPGELGMPRGLRAVAVPAADLPMLAEAAMQQQRLLLNNPRPLARGDALAIYRAAW